MAELSPADQIMIAVTHVHQAHGGDPPARAVAAAVLVAAADQVVPPADQATKSMDCLIRSNVRRELLAIAAELGLGGQP